MDRRRDVVGVVGAGTAPAEHHLPLDLGPHHPSQHGSLRLELVVEGDLVVSCRPVVGFVHRGVEKLFEVRDYRQAVVLANRHDWLSAFSSEIGLVLAVERMLGMEVPERVTWARTLVAELNRVLSHLFFLGCVPQQLRGPGPSSDTTTERGRVQDVMEELSGGRLHFMMNRVGGLKEDLPAGWLDRVAGTVAVVQAALPRLRSAILDDAVLHDRLGGVGVLGAATVDAYGVTGVAARASGVDLDLRRDDPYLAYGRLVDDGVLRIPTRSDGDCWARYEVLLEQVAVSLDLVRACADHLSTVGPGPVNLPLPKSVRAPEGQTYAWTENPLGVNGYHLVSTGGRTPWRLKLRTASFNNVAALAELVVGCRVGDLVPILSSVFFVIGDIDK